MPTLLDTICAFPNLKVAVFGDAMIDRYVFGEVDRISPEAPIPVFKSVREEAMLGGAGNVARNIVHLGGQATLIGVIGADEAGQMLIGAAQRESGLTARLVCDPGRPTTVKTRYVAHGQQLIRVDQESQVPACEQTTRELLVHLEATLEFASVLVCSDYAKGVITPVTMAAAISRASARAIPVVVDPKARDLRQYTGATVITPNAHEAALATGIACDSAAGLHAAAVAISERTGCRYVIITQGGKGLSVLDTVVGGKFTHFPAELREVHDVSGAGDSVVAALALALAAGAPIELSARLANLAGGVAVGKSGTAAVEAAELIAADQSSHAEGVTSKVASIGSAIVAANAWRRKGQRIVFANGCFDLLHPGHVQLLQKAKKNGDRLVVAINSDESASRLKGNGRPIQTEDARAFVLSSLTAVDLVVIFPQDTPIDLIEVLQPDVLVKGADYSEAQVVGADFVRRRGGKVLLLPIVDGYSTTRTVDRAVLGSTNQQN